MKRLFIVPALLVLCATDIVSRSLAAPITFTYTGTASGVLRGIGPDVVIAKAAFAITAVSDTDKWQPFLGSYTIISDTASIWVEGVGTLKIQMETRTFFNDSSNLAGFSRGGELDGKGGGAALFYSPRTPLLDGWDRLSSIGPIVGDVELVQWSYPVFTDGGVLIFEDARVSGSFLAAVDAGPISGAQLVNISCRAYGSTGDNVTIGGFVIAGSAPKRVLMRAVGPTLSSFGIGSSEVLQDPMIEVYDASHGNAVIATNDNWGDNENAVDIVATGSRLGAFNLASSDTRSAALLKSLQPGVYSFIARGKDATSGITLIELYDADPAGTDSTFINISARAYCTTNNGVSIGGFVVSGNAPKRILLRAVGPTLTSHGISATKVLNDPIIEVYDASHGNGLIATNDNWGDNQNLADVITTGARVGATPLASDDTKSSAMLLMLQPGVYSFIARGTAGTSGIVLLEVYDAD